MFGCAEQTESLAQVILCQTGAQGVSTHRCWMQQETNLSHMDETRQSR